jgi:hypothetical protein
MPFKETFETPKECEVEIQKFLTFLEEHKFYCRKAIESNNIMKAYIEECEIESSLKFLNKFLKNQIEEQTQELKVFKQGVAIESLKLKCKQIDKWIEMEFQDDENENFGEDDE